MFANIIIRSHSILMLLLFILNAVCAQLLSCVQLFGTPWTVARQAPLSVGSSRQEYWSRLPFPPPGNLPDSGIKPLSLESSELAGRFFTTWATREAQWSWISCNISTFCRNLSVWYELAQKSLRENGRDVASGWGRNFSFWCNSESNLGYKMVWQAGHGGQLYLVKTLQSLGLG